MPLMLRIRYLLEASGFFFLMGIFKLLGVDGASAFGAFLGRFLYYHLPAGKVARENLQRCYPEKSDAWREHIVKTVCTNLGRVVGEYPHLKAFQPGKGRVELVGIENGLKAVAKGKGVIFYTGHFSNWEVTPSIGLAGDYKGRTVYRPPNNPYVSNWINKQRVHIGSLEMIPKGPRGTRQIFTNLRRGHSIYMLVDQKTGQGIFVPFFGREAKTTPAPAAFALRMGVPLVPVSTKRLKGAHFRITVYPETEFSPTGDEEKDIHDLTAVMTAWLEAYIRENPTDWLWTHHRWQTAKKKARDPAGKH